MLIDWFTVLAQILNFLVLMWLLKRFLYKPVLKAIDERDSKIKAQVQEAADKMKEATTEKESYEKKNAAFEEQHKAMLNTATEEAANKRKQLLDTARNDADALQAKMEQSLREQQQSLNGEIIRRTQQEVFSITRQVLKDLANEDLEAAMTTMFLEKLKGLKKEETEKLVAVLKDAPQGATVRSAFPLPQEEQKEIAEALHKMTSPDTTISFETAEDQISGIELSAGGYKLAWSISDYLRSLEEDMGALLKQNSGQNTEPTTTQTSNERAAK